jgi:putative heme-binding domain-containing protein
LIGPDLTAVSSRFGRADLLDHILNPTKAVDEKYRLAVITLTDGTEVSGTVEREGDVLIIQPIEPDLDPVEIPSTRIRSRTWSDVSPMPAGLLDAFRKEQVYDLLAFLESLRSP